MNQNDQGVLAPEEVMPAFVPGETQAGKKGWRDRMPIAVASCAVALSITCCLCCAFAPLGSPPENGDPGASSKQSAVVTHEHDWAIDYETVHHDAQTHEEIVQPVYETVITNHSVCNECNELIDGRAAEHIVITGHSGYSTNVPVEETRKVADGRIDVIEDSPEYDELVATGRTCTICGRTS